MGSCDGKNWCALSHALGNLRPVDKYVLLPRLLPDDVRAALLDEATHQPLNLWRRIFNTERPLPGNARFENEHCADPGDDDYPIDRQMLMSKACALPVLQRWVEEELLPKLVEHTEGPYPNVMWGYVKCCSTAHQHPHRDRVAASCLASSFRPPACDIRRCAVPEDARVWSVFGALNADNPAGPGQGCLVPGSLDTPDRPHFLPDLSVGKRAVKWSDGGTGVM